MASFQRIHIEEFRGWLREELASSLPSDFFRDPTAAIRTMEHQVIKESRRRWALIFTSSIGRVFLKRDTTQGMAEPMKYLFFPSKARKEWQITSQLTERNLPVPRPLGWIERSEWGFLKESYYFSEAIGTGTSIIDLSPPWEESAIAALSRIVKAFHEAGLFHRDLHGGNFLWDGKSYVLTDLHRSTLLRSLSLRQRLGNLSQLFHSMRSQWKNEDCVKFLEDYFEEGTSPVRPGEVYFREILTEMEGLQKRQWKSRTKRCLKNSTEFSVTREKGRKVYRRRDFSLDRLTSVLRNHQALVKEKPSSLLKYSPDVIVSVVPEGREPICVKQFLYPRLIDQFREEFRRPTGLKAWIAGNGLKARGVPCPNVLAYVKGREAVRPREDFLLMEALTKGLELDRYLLKGFRHLRAKRRFIKAFAQWLSHFHKMGLYHRDMKTCNLSVVEDGTGWLFYPLDLEDVRLDEATHERMLFRNFLQLNTSVPRIITRTDRYRFYKEYHCCHPLIKNGRTFLRRLIRRSRQRGIVYVSPQGTVKEERC